MHGADEPRRPRANWRGGRAVSGGRSNAARLETQDSHGQPAGREHRADHPADEPGLEARNLGTHAGGSQSRYARRQKAHASDAGDVGRTARLVALLFLSTCRNYKVSNERSHRIAIEAKLLKDIVSQMNRVKHRRYCDIVRRLR